MSITVEFSEERGGSAVTDLDHGSKESGNVTSVKTLYIRHDGNNDITNFRLYVDDKSGVYTGSRTAAIDKAELLEWGDSNIESRFGGVQFNFMARYGFEDSDWGIYSNKSPTRDSETAGVTVRTGVGDSVVNAVLVSTGTGASEAGVIPSYDADSEDPPNIRFQMRLKIPQSGAHVGTKQFDVKGVFSYTS
jgi:hypothetical protein